MPMVRPFPILVEQLAADFSLLPSVDELRPACCPLCRQPSMPPGKPLGLVGHGTYERQVLGLDPGRELTIPVRRYLCRNCPHTMSVLPDELYPGRLYTAIAILSSLWLILAKGRSARDARSRFGSPGDTEGWRTSRRWRGALASRLWGWIKPSLDGDAKPLDRKEGRRRLARLLGHAGLAHTCNEDDIVVAARRLTREWQPVGHV